MALTMLHQLTIPLKLVRAARVIVSKDRILKNRQPIDLDGRNDKIQAILGRLKEFLNEDEIIVIAKQESFKHDDHKDRLVPTEGHEDRAMTWTADDATVTGATVTARAIGRVQGLNYNDLVRTNPIYTYRTAAAAPHQEPEPWRPLQGQPTDWAAFAQAYTFAGVADNPMVDMIEAVEPQRHGQLNTQTNTIEWLPNAGGGAEE